MFESLQERYGTKYGLTIHSRSPWLVTFENFVTDAEAQAIVSSVNTWERSTDIGQTNEFGETGRILSQGRTSSNAWCMHECEQVSDILGFHLISFIVFFALISC